MLNSEEFRDFVHTRWRVFERELMGAIRAKDERIRDLEGRIVDLYSHMNIKNKRILLLEKEAGRTIPWGDMKEPQSQPEVD